MPFLQCKSFFIVKYDKKYLKQIVELFINTVHNINKQDYSKEQLNAWANPKYDLKTWEKRFEKSKPHLCILEDEVRKNLIKRGNVELVNFSMER